jgi:hypothetical protein
MSRISESQHPLVSLVFIRILVLYISIVGITLPSTRDYNFICARYIYGNNSKRFIERTGHPC